MRPPPTRGHTTTEHSYSNPQSSATYGRPSDYSDPRTVRTTVDADRRANDYSAPRMGAGDDRRYPAPPPPASAPRRTYNEFFIPRTGIDREVITADIARYLGNDASVRLGTQEDPRTRTRQEGYFINAYLNLTSAMIADLKADSERWEAERQRTIPRARTSQGMMP
jgi:hypothetical protein